MKIEREFREKFGADYEDLILWIRSNELIKGKIIMDIFTDENSYDNK